MKKEAESHAAEDKAKRELIDLKNRADGAVYQTRKALEEHGDKVDAAVRGKIESALSSVEDKLKEDNKAALQAALTELENVSMELGKHVYEAAKAQGTGSAGGSSQDGQSSTGSTGDSDDDVVDAEFKVKDGE